MNFLGLSFGKKNQKFNKNKTTQLYQSEPYVNHMLVQGNFKTIVELPKYVDIHEWLAFNTLEFFNHLNLFYGSITAFCTPQDCPTMSAGPGVEYTWSDSLSKKVRLSAPQYIDYMTTSMENTLNDESIFPTRSGADFPKEVSSVIKRMFVEMFRLFAHIYHEHYDKVLNLNEEPHFNSLFAHFISFAKEFDLLDKKELQPLGELIEIMFRNGVICT